MNPILKNRLKSLAWRTAMMFITVFITVLLDNLDLLNLSTELTVFVGLILGEVSKYLKVDRKVV